MGWIAAGLRRGPVTQPPGPPGSQQYGPTAGRAAIIAGTGPTTVTDPGGGITFTTRAGLQSAIDSNAANSTFVFTGTTLNLDARIFTQTKNPTIIFPGNKIIDGGNIDSPTQFMFGGQAGGGGGPFTVRGGTWQNFGAPGSTNPITVFNCTNGSGTVIEDVTIASVAVKNGRGIQMGTNTIVRRCLVHHCGMNGFGCAGTGSLVQKTETHDNGFIFLDSTPADGGSGKFATGSGVTVEECYSHDEDCFSWWCDNGNTLNVRESVIEDCRKAGPEHELCQQGGEVYRCWLARNGETAPANDYFSGLVTCVQSSPNANGLEYYENHIEGAERLLGVVSQVNRPTTHNVNIHHNRFKFTSSAARIGGQDNQTVRTIHNDSTITWDNNLYQFVGSITDPVHQYPTATSNLANLTWAQWQAAGRDLNSVREVVPS